MEVRTNNGVIEQQVWNGMPGGVSWRSIPGAIRIVSTPEFPTLVLDAAGRVYWQSPDCIPGWMTPRQVAFDGTSQDTPLSLVDEREAAITSAIAAAVLGEALTNATRSLGRVEHHD